MLPKSKKLLQLLELLENQQLRQCFSDFIGCWFRAFHYFWAGLTSIIKQGKIGNAYVGKGDWLIIEADESDGSVVQYEPEIGLL